MDLSTGVGFASTRWTSPTPQPIRNGGSSNDFRVLAGNLDDDGRADLATISPNAGGAWSFWNTLDRSTGGGARAVVL